MTPEEKQQFNELLALKRSLEMSSTFPLRVDQALQGRGFLRQGGEFITAVENGGTGSDSLTGILKGNGNNPFTVIVPLAGTKQYYVADSSGGTVNRRLTFLNGVLTSES